MQFCETLFTGEHLIDKENILEGVYKAKEKYEIAFLRTKEQFYPELSEDFNRAFITLLSSVRYGQIYWINNSDAKNNVNDDDWTCLADKMEFLDNLVSSEIGFIRLINNSIFHRILDEENKTTRTILVPKFGYGGLEDGKLYYNPDDLKEYNKVNQDLVLSDLHDEVHILTSSFSNNFASKYYNNESEAGLESLSSDDKRQIISHPSRRIQFSDGHILSTITFQAYYENSELEDFALIKKIGKIVERELSNKTVTSEELGRSDANNLEVIECTPEELAILMQNKMYEGSVSTLESNVFTRGGAEGNRGRPNFDKLFNLSPVQRLIYLADQNTNYITHHQHRNTIRNAGQIFGYILKAKEMLKRHQNVNNLALLRAIIQQGNFLLTGQNTKPTKNLFNIIYDQRKN